MPEEGEQEIDIDEKTKRVFKKKGYKIDKRLSAGAFGQVYRAVKDGQDEFTAVKVMDLAKVSTKFKAKFLPRELAALIEVKHPNIVQVHDIFRANQKIYIFMEFAGGGDIASYLKKNGAMDEPSACKWFTQQSEALNYLHNEKFMAHRDIKIDNVLLTDDQKDTKLSDFGFAKEGWDEEQQKVILSETYCGTEPYYCPELVQRIKYDPFKADVWAMGVVLFAMLNNKFPFHFGKPKIQLAEQKGWPDHLNKRFVKKHSKHCKDLIFKMLNPNQEERYGMREVCKHKWIHEEGNCHH